MIHIPRVIAYGPVAIFQQFFLRSYEKTIIENKNNFAKNYSEKQGSLRWKYAKIFGADSAAELSQFRLSNKQGAVEGSCNLPQNF